MSTNQVMLHIGANITEFLNATKIIPRSLEDVEKQVRKTGSAFSELGSMVKTAVLGFSAYSIGQEAINAALSLEKMGSAMSAAFGGAAAREMQYVKEEAQRLGLSMEGAASGYAKFSAATKNTSIEGEEARKVFSGVSEAVTALKLSAEESNGIFLALWQIMSKGKVSAEELSGQLGERLPGAVKLAADAMGMTTAELLKQMEQGKIMSADLLPKLAEQLHKTYGAAAAEAAKTGQSEINRFNNAMLETKGALGAALMPAFTDFLGLVTKGSQYVKAFIGGWQMLSVSVFGFVDKAQALSRNGGLIKLLFSGDARASLAQELVNIDKAVEEQKAEIFKRYESGASSSKSALEITTEAARNAERRRKEREAYSQQDAEKQKKAALKNFQSQGKAIIDLEKDRVKTLLDIEKEYLKKINDAYDEQVKKLVSLQKTVADLNKNKADRDNQLAEERAAAMEDSYQKYYRQQQEIATAESANDSTWADPEKKLKAYDDLIGKARTYYDDVRQGKVESVSIEQAERDYLIFKERMESKIKDVADEQIRKQETLAEQSATAAGEMEKRVKAHEDQLRMLDQMLQNLPKVVDIAVNLKVNGMQQLMGIPGVMANTGNTGGAQHFGDYYTMGGNTYWASDGSLAEEGTSVALPFAAVGTSYVPKTGVYQLHQGEQVKSRQEVARSTGSGAVTVTGGITVNLPNVTNQTSARELARQILPELQALGSRYSRAAA